MPNAKRGGKPRSGASLASGILLLVSGLVFLGLAASAKFTAWATPELFEARTIIRAAPGGAEDSTTNSAAYGDFYFIQTEFEVLRSQMILDNAITNLDLPHAWAAQSHTHGPLDISECRRRLREAMTLKSRTETNAIELRVRGQNRTETARIANAIADAYLEHYERQWQERQAALSNAYQAQLSALDAKISLASERASQLKTNLGITDPAKSAALQSISQSQDHESGIDKPSQVVKEEQTLASLKAMDRQQLRNALPGVSSDASLPHLLQKLNQAELKLATLNPDRESEQNEALHARASIDELNQKIDGRAQGILLAMETHIATLKEQIKLDEARSEAARKSARQAAESQRPYYEAKQEVQDLENRRETLRTKIEAEIKSPKSRNVAILSRAEPPAEPIPGNLLLRPALLGGGAVSSLAGLVLLIRWSRAKFVTS